MKKILLLSFIFLHLLCIAQKNNYTPFPSDMISYGYIHHGTADNEYYTVYREEIHGDTTLNGVHYSNYYLAVKGPADPYKNPYPGDINGSYMHLSGAIRNDLGTRKVYLYSFGTKTEEVLYDFDLHVGDTIFKDRGYGFYRSLLSASGFQYPMKIDTAWVSRIDSVLMPHDGLYHRRFNFNAKFKLSTEELINSDSIIFNMTKGYRIKIDPLIEGIGFVYNPVRLVSLFEYQFELYSQCVSVDGKPVYSNPNTPAPFIRTVLCNSIFTGINESKNDLSITVYPNPSDGKFELTTNLKAKLFEINNVLGTSVFRSNIQTNTTEIDLSTQAPGIYFIRVYADNGTVLTKKIIVN